VHTVVGVVAVLWAGWVGPRIPVGARDIFLVSKMSSLALGPIQPPVQWITRGFIFRMWSGQGM